jgi:elongation factor 1-beta
MYVRNAVLKVLIKMANVVITMKVMPESPEVDLAELQKKLLTTLHHSGVEGDVKVAIEPIAFGLKAIVLMFVLDEKKGGTDKLEEELKTIHFVESVQVTDVRRTIG